jgi:2-phosphosulfolactate phosphatase
MKIAIQSLLEGARGARGDVVLIDVFTSTTLIATLLDRGATRVLPMQSASRARSLGREQPGTILMGERWGKKLPGFHHNTSAVRGSELDVVDRQVVLSTTNGTLGIVNAKHADRLFLGCFRNAGAIARRLAGASEVTLVPIGVVHGRVRALEDELCARVIRSRLLGEEVDLPAIERRLRADASVRLRNLGRGRDVAFCLQLDAVETVPEVRGGVVVAG